MRTVRGAKIEKAYVKPVSSSRLRLCRLELRCPSEISCMIDQADRSASASTWQKRHLSLPACKKVHCHSHYPCDHSKDIFRIDVKPTTHIKHSPALSKIGTNSVQSLNRNAQSAAKLPLDAELCQRARKQRLHRPAQTKNSPDIDSLSRLAASLTEKACVTTGLTTMPAYLRSRFARWRSGSLLSLFFNHFSPVRTCKVCT